MTVCAVSGAASKRTVAASSDEIAAAAATVLGALGTTGRTASVAEAQAATMLLHTALKADPNVLNDPQVITTPGRRPTSAGMNLVGLGLESRPKESARLDREVSVGWASPSSRGLCGGDALLLSSVAGNWKA